MGNKACYGVEGHNGNKASKCNSKDCKVMVCPGEGCGTKLSSGKFICMMCHLSDYTRTSSVSIPTSRKDIKTQGRFKKVGSLK